MNWTSPAAKRPADWRIALIVLPQILGLIGSPALAQRPSPEAVAESALMESAFNGKLDVVQQLVSAGISVNAHDPEQRTSLMWAAFNGHTPVVSFLLEHGAEVDAKDKSKRTALMYASSGPFKQTVELLLKNGADANVQGSLEGFTALMTAAAEGQLEVVRVLLAYGANADLKDQDGDTAQNFAEQKGHTAVVDLLKIDLLKSRPVEKPRPQN
jgi:ankyrin repeat protein